jgi:phosphoglycolate phosphatase
MSNKLVVFDCDGTLVDSQHMIFTAMARAFEGEKLPPPDRQRVLSIIGLSLPQAMARLLPDAQAHYHDHMSEGYKRAFQAMRAEKMIAEPLYPGIVELIVALDAAGWMLGVATGKSDRGLALCLAHHGIADHFLTLQTADRHPSKPHPAMLRQAMAEAGAEPETTVMIGDTHFDIDMGLAAGTRTIGVAWGYHSVEELRDAGAHAIAMDMTELHRHIGPP